MATTSWTMRMSPTTRTTTSGPGRGGKRPRHVPTRTCVGCRETGAQSSFVRVVRRPDGAVEPDEGHRRSPGRGAYVHRDLACWERALRRPHAPLGRALRATINPEGRDALLDYAVQFERSAGADTRDDGAHGSDVDAAPRAAQPDTEAGHEEPDR